MIPEERPAGARLLQNVVIKSQASAKFNKSRCFSGRFDPETIHN